jgi:hypothetical protein
MSNPIREDFKEIIKNNEYNNISIRVIKTGKYEDTKSIISYNQIPKQTFSPNIINNYSSKTTPIMKKNSQTSFNNPQDNKKLKVLDFKNNPIINKITTSDLRKFGKKLIGLKHIESSNDFEKNIQKDHHAIYISKNFDSSKNNIIESNNINNNISQITSKNKLYTNLVKRPNILNNIQSHPKGKNFSNLYSINIQNIDNKYIITNPGFDTNTYRNSNFQQTNLQNYNILTIIPKKESNDKIPRNKRKENKVYYNNTLTTINDIKRENLLQNEPKRKVSENLKQTKISANTSFKDANFFFNPLKNYTLKNVIPRPSLNTYGSKDNIYESMAPKANINLHKVIHIKNPQNSGIFTEKSNNPADNIKYKNNNFYYITNEVSNIINVQPKLKISNSNLESKLEDRNVINSKRLLKKNDIRKIINKSFDFNILNHPKIYGRNNILNQINKINNNEYVNSRIKEEEKEDSFNTDEEKSNGKNREKLKYNKIPKDKTKIIKKNKRLIKFNQNGEINRNIIYRSQQKQKEPSDSIRRVIKIKKNLLKRRDGNLKNINIYYIDNANININETKNQNINTASKSTYNLKDNENLKTEMSEKINYAISNTKDNRPKIKINMPLTVNKNLNDYLDKDQKDNIDKETKKETRLNLKSIDFTKIKNYFKKNLLNRKIHLTKSLNKYQYIDEDQKRDNITMTDEKLSNYTYLELKDIKNIKRDTFITLHSIGGLRDEKRIEDFDKMNMTHKDFNFKEFKPYLPYVALHPNKKYKKRGLARFRVNSERKVSGIKIIGNSDSIEYKYDKYNFSTVKNRHFQGKLIGKIHNEIKEVDVQLERDYSYKNLNQIKNNNMF